MLITEQQYNAVVAGMRQQLELYRAQINEKIQLFHQQVAETQKVQAELDQMRKCCEYWLDRSDKGDEVIRAAVGMCRGEDVTIEVRTGAPGAELFDEIGILRTKLQKSKKK